MNHRNRVQIILNKTENFPSISKAKISMTNHRTTRLYRLHYWYLLLDNYSDFFVSSFVRFSVRLYHFSKHSAIVVRNLSSIVFLSLDDFETWRNKRKKRSFNHQWTSIDGTDQTWTTRISKPVSAAKVSRTCRAGFGLVLYACLRISNCFWVIVVRGRLLVSSNSKSKPSSNVFLCPKKRQTFIFQCFIIEFTDEFLIIDQIKFIARIQLTMTN